MAYGWLKCLCEQKGSSFSCYHARSYYTFIMRIGKGKEVTDALLQLNWGKSWLSGTIRKGL